MSDIPSDSSDPPPSYLPTRAKVKFELKWISELISNRVSTPSLRFICDFERDETNAFYYVIYFQVDGSYLNFGYDLVVYDTAKAYVTEETLVSAFGFTAGITVSCSVGVRSSRNGRTGYLVSSEGFYAGIKMLNHSVTVERGKSGSVYFEQTIPFGCMYYPSLVQSICTLNLHITRMSTENTCSSNTIHHRGQCALELPGLTKSTGVSSDTWTSQIHDFKMVSIESERSYYRLSNHQFLFNLETSSSHHQFWRNSQSDKLLEVLVSEGEETRNWQGRKCQVYCDPHMLSFDGMNYELQYKGKFMLFKSESPPMQIYLPTGAVVSVRHRSNGLLDIDITPTVHEFKRNISGLCGDFNGTVENDCVSKNGNMPCDEPFQGQRGYRYHPNSFTESYKQYGKCNNNRKEVRCTAMQRRLIRKKRQVESTDDMQGHSITKRSTVIDETEAIRLCTEALKTVTNEACSDIGVNATGIEINNCAADLMLTGDGNWTKYAVDRSEAICLETIEKNTTLQEEYPEISNIIRNNTCPLNCSERGSCTNGKCECEEGFASEDCSFDLNTPLQIYGLDNDGLCDIDEGCGFVVVEGLEFPSDRNYTCQFSGRMTMVGEIYQTLEVFNVSADHQSIFEIICDIPDIDVPVNRLGIEYNVSVAMDGFEFGDAINFVVINTICQNYNNISGNISFYIQNGFCFINGTCYPEGAYKENALCLECKPNENVYTWSKSSSEDCVVSDKDTLDSNTNFMVVVVSAAGGFLFVCLLIFVMCCIYKKKNKSRQELSDITISESVHGKEELPSLAWLNEDMLISNILTKAKNKASLPKKNKRTKNPDIRNPKHDSHVTEDHSTSYISNASLKSTEGCDKERKKEISIQVKQASSNGVFTDTDERISSVATPNEEDSRDRILSRVEKETGRTNSNQRTQIKTDVGSTDLRSREREPALLESMLQSITSEGTGKRKKKKRKRDRRKVQPESMISEFAIVTEDENDRRAQKKSKKRKKERRKEISHPLRHADPLSDFCGDEEEGVPSVAVQIDEVSRSRIEMKTEHGTARTNSVQNTKILEIDFNDGMTMVSDFCDEDEGVPSVAVPIDEVSRSRIEMKTEHGTARTYSVQNTKILELDFNDGMNIAKTLITDVNSNDLQRRGDTKEREPALSESMMQSNTSKATGKRKTKKRRDRKKKAPESPIGAADFVTEQHNDRRCKKKSKKIKKEQRKEQKRKSKHANSVGFCSNEDKGVPCEEAPEEEFSRNKIEMEAENEEARKRSNQKIQIIDSQSTDPDSKDDLYKAYLPMTNVATNNSLSREDTREREPTLLESILRLNPPKGTGKRKTKKRRKKRKNVHPIFL
ncbi:uncharacterized protein LOC117332258 [Pecten maximus]|uniref:uncharacterized protein LOC117332258 n=1 Tax=Pecten maximus TaxID=6579 RepID=UPI0014582F6A|nr:uncharacterized protein LOC117332258 [Pecten maximus]